MKTKLSLLFALSAALLPTNSFAWSKAGHRVVAELAEKILQKENPRVFAKAQKILKGKSFADVSNWADEIIGDAAYSSKYLDQWHFLNIPDGYTFANVPRRPNGDALTAMTQAEAILSGKTAATDQEKEEWLKLYIHYVGDMQQPLHVSRPGLDYYKQCGLPTPGPEVAIDRGGNDITVLFHSKKTNLHSVWDGELVATTDLSYTELAGELYRSLASEDAEELKRLASDPFETWVSEALDYRPQVYDSSFWDVKEGNPALGRKYVKKHLDTLKRRLLLGGVRLAYRLGQVL